MKKLVPILAVIFASLNAAIIPQNLQRPLQPFLVEILAQERGKWDFIAPLGSSLAHTSTISLQAYANIQPTALGILLESPEFPGDLTHADWLTIPPDANGIYTVKASIASFKLSFAPVQNNLLTATLSDIKLGEARSGDWNVTGLFALCNSTWRTLEPVSNNHALKLQTARVGNVFSEGEDAELFVTAWDNLPHSGTLTITAYGDDRPLTMTTANWQGLRTRLSMPMNRFGSFTATLSSSSGTSSVRFVYLPKPQELDCEQSFLGMNIFQQQHWYYSYQLPLFAAAGVRWIRPWLAWENTTSMLAPKPDVRNFKHLDATIRRLAKYQQKYEFMFYQFPAWLLGTSHNSDRTAIPEANWPQWEAFVKELVTHCSPQVRDYEIWNEPDLCAGRNATFTADFYADFAHRTAAAIRAANPHVRIHTLSHSGDEAWLSRVGELKTADVSDVITLHRYKSTTDFYPAEMKRQFILDTYGFSHLPQYFNEIGQNGYDGNDEYTKAIPNTSELDQARHLIINSAQALHFAGPKGQVYWFCSLDPRDSATQKGRTWDSAIGLLYIGGQPKLGYAALAAFGKLLDGHPVLGRVEPAPKLRYVAFADNRAVIWQDGKADNTVTATAFGCAPDEQLTLYDMFANPISSARADSLQIPLHNGPFFLLGSAKLGKTAAPLRQQWLSQRIAFATAEKQVSTPAPLSMARNATAVTALKVPSDAALDIAIPPQLHADISHKRIGNLLELTVKSHDVADGGLIAITVTLADKALPQVNRVIPVNIDRTCLILDGSFYRNDLSEWQLTGRESFDAQEHAMRLEGPFNSRLHLYCKSPYRNDKPLHFSAKVKGHLSQDVRMSFCSAFFRKLEGSGWINTWSPAQFGENTIVTEPYKDLIVTIPDDISEWTSISATLPAGRLSEAEAKVIFFIDIRGGNKDDLFLVKDLKLYY